MPALRRRVIAVACFVSITAGVWFWLGRLEHIDWLVVAGPTHAVAGEPVTLRVHVAHLKADTMLCVDLHWAQDRNTSMGFLAAGEPRAVGKTSATFDFTIPVPARDNLRFVNGIIYLSPDGSWGNHTFVAATDLIPLTTARDVRAIGLVRLPVHQLAEAAARVPPPRSSLLRWATGLVWLFCAAMLGRQHWRARQLPESARKSPHWGFGFAVGFALAGIWELAGFENPLGNWARSWAKAEDIYYPRALFQKAVFSLILARVVVWFGFGGRQCRIRLWLLSFGFYLVLTTVNLLSLHALDQYAAAGWLGLTFIDALKFLCAMTTLVSLYRTKGQSTETALT